MKKIKLLTVGMIVLLLTSCVSTGVAKTPLTIQTIIEVPNTSQTDLYVRANSAAVEMFNNASSVIQYSDKDAGVIKGKFIISNVLEGIYYHRINIIISIEVKDNKMRLSFSDINATCTGDVLNGHYRQERMTFTVDETSGVGKKVKSEIDSFVKTFSEKIKTVSSDW